VEEIMDQIVRDVASLIKCKNKKMIIGISGHGASGKTTFAKKLIHLLGEDEVNYINTDPYIVDSNLRKQTLISYEYKGERHEGKITACHPSAHHRNALERDVQMIRSSFDFYTIGTHYLESILISARKRISIIEGMSVAFTNLNLYDRTIYLYTNEETELMRRSERDVFERGMDLDYLRRTHQERRIQYDVFMHAYHRDFDIVIKNSNENFILEKSK
jgi:uridine kinase